MPETRRGQPAAPDIVTAGSRRRSLSSATSGTAPRWENREMRGASWLHQGGAVLRRGSNRPLSSSAPSATSPNTGRPDPASRPYRTTSCDSRMLGCRCDGAPASARAAATSDQSRPRCRRTPRPRIPRPYSGYLEADTAPGRLLLRLDTDGSLRWRVLCRIAGY